MLNTWPLILQKKNLHYDPFSIHAIIFPVFIWIFVPYQCFYSSASILLGHCLRNKMLFFMRYCQQTAVCFIRVDVIYLEILGSKENYSSICLFLFSLLALRFLNCCKFHFMYHTNLPQFVDSGWHEYDINMTSELLYVPIGSYKYVYVLIIMQWCCGHDSKLMLLYEQNLIHNLQLWFTMPWCDN